MATFDILLRGGTAIDGSGSPARRADVGILGRYVRERGVLSLETAIAKLTSVAAERPGLRDRGAIREGVVADIVVFDPAMVTDVATYLEPARHPAGIEHVIVNGRLATRHGIETGKRSGRLLRRA